jgi:hypothetical protein
MRIVVTVLYCTVLYCTVLYCTVLYCTVLYCTAVVLLSDNLKSPSLCRKSELAQLAVSPRTIRSIQVILFLFSAPKEDPHTLQVTMTEPDELYTLRAQFSLGHYQLALEEAKTIARRAMSVELKSEREEFVQRSQLALGQTVVGGDTAGTSCHGT